MSSVLSYHKQQRQKEIKKNKAKRIAERDAKVAESASLHDIQTQINKLEKQKTYQNGHLDNKDVRKLERLQKELKIVKASEEERKKKAEEKAKLEWEQEKKRMSTKEGVDELNAQKFKKAKASVYYDAVLNPFGAPPPGQPMMYHKRGGGTTMNIREASIPQHLRSGDVDDTDEEDLYIHPSSHQNLNSKQEYQRDDHQTFQRTGLKRETIPPPIPSQPPPPPVAPPAAAPLPSQKVPTKPIETKKSSGTPILPPPSESVQRLNKKGKNKKALDADIWASTDELLYEGNLEGIHDETKDKQEPQYPNKKRRKVDADEERFDPLCPADEGYGEYRSSEQIKRSTTTKKKKDVEGGTKKCSWYYIDQGDNIQGPFSSEQMFGWREVGFFPDNTMVRNGADTEFVEISSVDLMTGELLHVGNEPSQSIEDRIAMLRAEHLETAMDKEGGGVDDRIAALRAELQPEVEGGEENEENDQLVGPMYHPESVSADNEDEQHLVAGPTVVDDEAVPSYPHVDTADEPYYEYPLPDVEQNESIPYPVDIDYPVDEIYPDTDSAYAPYPNTDAAFDGNGDEEETVPYYYGSSVTGTNEDQVKVQKQVYTGDSAVVKMVPSNIRNRRQKITKQKKTILKKGDDQPKPMHDHKPLTDDYEDFMLEVQALK